MQAAGDLVPPAAELAACVKHGVHDLERVLARGVLADRDPAAVIDHLDLAIGVDRDVDACGHVGHRFVDAVVDHLPDELVQTAAVGRADVHAGALANGGQSLQDLDVGGGVVRGGLAARPPGGLDAHDPSVRMPAATPRVITP